MELWRQRRGSLGWRVSLAFSGLALLGLFGLVTDLIALGCAPSQSARDDATLLIEVDRVQRINGVISFDELPGDLSKASMHVRLLDTSYADAPSKEVAQVTIIGDELRQILRFQSTVNFSLEVESIDPNANYNVSVFVDVDGDGQVGVGDYLSVEAYPVISYGYPDQVSIEVRRVK